VQRAFLTLLAFASIVILGSGPAVAEPRIALVVGNGAYAQGPLKTPLADAGLVATALNSVGFEIIEGADLNQTDLRARFREFLDKVAAAGPDAVALVYFAGYGLQFEGENYLVPVDARFARETDIPIEAIRVSDLMRPLAGTAAHVKLLILDGARGLPFPLEGAKLARGLGAMEAAPSTLVALSAAPGTLVAQDAAADYGVYAKALAEMIRAPGLDLDALFTRTRVRTHEVTQGGQTPWHVSAVTSPFVLDPGGQDAAAQDPTQPPAAPAPLMAKRNPRPMRDLGPDDAYALAIERDDLPTYVEYVQTYPRSPYARRIWAQIRARREALAWMRAVERDTPEAYWTYLRRYPGGVYAFDAQRRLRRLSARFEPPPGFAPMEFADVPPPLADEPREAYGAYEAGPPPPRWIAPPPPFFVNLRPPPPPRGPRLLPIPMPMPVSPRFGTPPPRLYAPPVGALSPPGGPHPGAKPPGPAGIVTPGGQPPKPPGGAQPPGGKPAGAVTTITPPRGPAPGAATPKKLPGGNPPGAKPPGAVTTITPPGGQPPKPHRPPGAKPPVTNAPAGVQPPKPPAAVTVPPAPPAAAAKLPPKPAPPAPPAAAAKLPPKPAPAAAATKQPPPGPRKKCPIVNGVENCKGT
jgi:uncharacterized caspase-like protein